MTKKPCTPKIVVTLVLLLFSAVAVSAAENKGKILFTEMKCSMCHAPQEDQARGPSLQHIASVYGFGGGSALFQYFADPVKPIVAPERAKAMKSKLLRIRKLTEAEQKSLAAYIMESL